MTLLAVNGTLMRGFPLNKNLLRVDASFVREDRTAPYYRIWSINDVHPAMCRVTAGGASVALEIWNVPESGLITVLMNEPPGLCIGKVSLESGQTVLGVLGEPYLCEEMAEITAFGGWRAYVESKK